MHSGNRSIGRVVAARPNPASAAKYGMRIDDFLCEMHFSDLYPRSFVAFHQKYLPLVSDDRLYVNFTDVVGNVLDKNFSPKPNHSDPIGLYAYPLDYVLRHPSEIEYGQQARFLRVIRDTSQHKLVLNTMTAEMAVELLTRMGIGDAARKMAFVQRRSGYFDGNLSGKQFLGVLQTYLEVGQTGVTPNRQQSALLLRAGIDALEDRSRSRTEAVLNGYEPEQCVFLSRAAFKVIDIYELRSQRARHFAHSDPREMLRRLPGLIAQAIGDRLVANNLTADRADKFSFYTAAKRKIVVMTSREYSFQVGHRQGASYSGHRLTVSIMGPDFAPITETYDAATTFEQIAEDMRRRFAARTPGTGEAYDLMSEHGPDIRADNDLVAAVCKKLNLPFTPATSDATAYRVYQTIRRVSLGQSRLHYLKRDALLAQITGVVRALWRDDRQPQGAQILRMYQAAAANRRITTVDLHDLVKIARRLGLVGWSGPAKTGDSARQTYGDLTVYRRGNDLRIQLGEREQTIATIDNQQLEDWQKPDGGNENFRIMLSHAADLCAYLNRHHYTVEGYATFLPQFYGVCYSGGRWMRLEDAATPGGHLGKIAIWTLPPDRDENGHRHVVGMMRGETDWSDLGPGYKGVVGKWQAEEILFTLNAQDQIVSIGHQLATYLRHEKYRKDSPSSYASSRNYPEDMYAGKDAGKQFFQELEAAHFDLMAFIEKHGYSLAPSALYKDSDLFGVVVNKDNDKFGKTYADVLNPVGEFAGLMLYSIVPATSQFGYANRYYLSKEAAGKPRELAQTTRDGYNGRSDVKLVHVRDDLTEQERAAVTALLAAKQITVPVKFRPLLAIGKRSRSTR